jgi:hypothetical protein
VTRELRRAAAALALAAALPALAYVLPVAGILKRMGEKRAALSLDALEVTGSVAAKADAPDAALPRSPGVAIAAGQVTAPASFRMKVPGRCRLELASPDAPEPSRPYVAVKDGKVSGAGGLERLPAAVALVRAACALLATHVAGDASEAYGAALAKRGVALGESSLGRFDGRIAYVVGGRPSPKEAKPLLYVEKDGFRPLRLVAQEGNAWYDVRLLGWGSPTGGDWFPRAVEVWTGDTLRLRFTTERTVQNPRIADAVFQ